MSDDLVTRLRRAVIWQGSVPIDNEIAMEASDEIERNRATMETQATLISDMRGEIERLKAIIAAKLHRRKCHDCGHVGWYADSRTPYCLCDRCCSWLCDRCRSWDTRRVKEAQ